MKHKSLGIFCALLLILAISGCGHPQPSPDLRTLSFPGTEWNMTPKELIDTLELENNHYSIEDTGNYYHIKNVHIDVFGFDSEVIFTFEDINSDGTPHLRSVYVAYPDETDFDSVLSSMKKLYGEPESENVYSWKSEGTYKDFMSQEDLYLINKQAEESGAGPQEWIIDPISNIFFHINSTRYKAYYNDTIVTNLIEFTSAVSAYTQEGGYSAMFPDD